MPRGLRAAASPVVLDGRPCVVYLALCIECNRNVDEPLPFQFRTQDDRDWWADAHRGGTGHEVRDALRIC